MSHHAFGHSSQAHQEPFEPMARRPRAWDSTEPAPLPAGRRYSTWPDVQKDCRGPQPHPDWLIEDAAAIDTELGLLKTGKEAELFLLRRATGEREVLLAAKRYRPRDRMQFTRSQAYTEGRQARRSRDNRAVGNASSYGRRVSALQWAGAEFTYLGRCHAAGLPVPYPVQLDGTELLMEFIADPSSPQSPAPRLQQLPRRDARLPQLWEQLVAVLEQFAVAGLAHGDLSAYNLLVAGDRLVVIDLPQCVDVAGNLQGLDYLQRDCVNICSWFTSRGLPRDPDALFTTLLATLFGDPA